MAKTVEKKCKKCKQVFYPREADVKRGWGKYCSKRCKAREQEQRTGQHTRYLIINVPKNYMGSGVSKETYEYYAKEYGGNPEFNRKGEYIGFSGCALSIWDHDPNKEP